MSHSEKIIVQAIIPHHDDPELHLVDSEGGYPSQLHETGTFEGTFRTIGYGVLGRILSVDRRRPELEESEQTIVYQAKPLGQPLDPGDNYRWMKRSR